VLLPYNKYVVDEQKKFTLQHNSDLHGRVDDEVKDNLRLL